MKRALHEAGHKYLKLLFVTALAGSSALFFIGSAVPKPPALVVFTIGGILGVALEWAYYTVSCDLTQSISEGSAKGIALNLLYTLIGAAASWYLFTNAALHVGWAPADQLLGLSREHWAMITAGLIVAIIFILSAQPERVEEGKPNLQAFARSVTLMLPHAPTGSQLQLLSAISAEAAKYERASLNAAQGNRVRVIEGGAEPAKVVEADQRALPAAQRRPARPGALKRLWQWAWSGSDNVQAVGEANEEGEADEDEREEAGEQEAMAQRSRYEAVTSEATTSRAESVMPDHLQLAIEALTANPNISDEALAEELGLKKPASARYWRLKAQEFLMGQQPMPRPSRPAEQRPPRSRQETIGDLRAFAQALKADTGLDLEAMVLQLLANAAKGPQASEQVDTAPLAPPVGETGAQPVAEYPPLPAARIAPPGMNHGNHGDVSGTFERWSVGGEGEGTNGSFRPTN